MGKRIEPADLSRVTTYPLAERANKVDLSRFGRPLDERASLFDFLDSLPDLLAVRSLRGLARAIVDARQADRAVVWAMGAHPIKVGLNPILIRMMDRGFVTALALNGAGVIHDWETAAIGGTSEDVAEGLDDGSFGMVEETGRAINAAAREAAEQGIGLGEAVGRGIAQSALPHRDSSVLAAAYRLGLPATVHVAVGGDIVHMHPSADGAAIGAASFTDFKLLAGVLTEIESGVFVNCGSAVQLPEVFLKALTVARNLGHRATPLTTANLDMQRHYRTEQNVLRRPTRGGGRSFSLIGHHEINVPLLAAAIDREFSRRAKPARR
ncbi:MAG TPA: hypothetical protein VD788_00635 [Candidatus Polarisedimenticolaceae bacterium]|nr:hypothetical protein [Candidatus Polarisedimenticolaceae bacterium]